MRGSLRNGTRKYPVVVGALVTLGLTALAVAGPVQGAFAAKGKPKTYSYGPHGHDNTLDVYKPTSAAARKATASPVVVLVHGGGWIAGDRAHFADAAHQFAKAGYVAVSVNYRLAGVAAWPAQRNDVRAAIDWVREHATTLKLDPDRLVVVGSSAGGEIAASVLTQGRGSRLADGLVTLSSPLDLARVGPGRPARDGRGQPRHRRLRAADGLHTGGLREEVRAGNGGQPPRLPRRPLAGVHLDGRVGRPRQQRRVPHRRPRRRA